MAHVYAFQLGRNRDLSYEEITSVCTTSRYHIVHARTVGEYALITTDTPIDVSACMARLGGTRLIGEKIIHSGDAASVAFAYLSQLPSDKKIHFSISGTKQAEIIARSVKKKLKGLGRSVRYIKTENTASILHNGLVERASHLTIIDNVVYVTRAIQPIEALSERDYGRPSIDDKSGMLPPKLSRIMINLTNPDLHTTVLLDPFCGSGTLLGEAISLGLPTVIGSDISKKAITDSEKNLTWLTGILSSNTTWHLIESDVQQIGSHIPPNSIDCIATEPYMGVARSGREQKAFLEKQARELSSLYIAAFAAFHTMLKPGGRVAFVIPRFRYHDDWIRLSCEADIARIGFRRLPYAAAEMPLVYAREEQHVVREIWRWEKI